MRLLNFYKKTGKMIKVYISAIMISMKVKEKYFTNLIIKKMDFCKDAKLQEKLLLVPTVFMVKNLN